jgi:RNA polymerase sigma-70 factor (ECF subfamily)
MTDSLRPTELPVPDAQFRAELVAAIPRLRSFARGLCYNRDLADDLAQEALVKAWAARASYRAGTNFRAWLFTILRNHFYSLSRRASRFAPWDPNLAARTAITPADQATNIYFADLERGLDRLPVEQREALVLVTAHGLSYEEAAAIMECAVGTVKSRVSRARIALVRFLEGAEEAPAPSRALPPEASHELEAQPAS